MRRRSALAALAVLAVLALTGCLGGSNIPERALAENATYDWETNATTEVTLKTGGFLESAEAQVVYSGEKQVLNLTRRGFTRAHAVDVRAVQYRYAENGTVVGHEAVRVSKRSTATKLFFPGDNGSAAFTLRRRDQDLQLRTFDGGSVRVILPEDHTVGDLLLGGVVPRGYERRQTDDGRVALYWSNLGGNQRIVVRHYSHLDWRLFYGLLGVTSVAALLVYLYFTRQIREIQRVREEHGLDLDEDDEGRNPPPGMG